MKETFSWRLRIVILLTLLLGVIKLVTSESYIDEDSIVIEAAPENVGSKSREKRQTMGPYLQNQNAFPRQQGIAPNQVQIRPGTKCTTSIGSEGQCSSLSQCYPDVFTQNQDVARLLLKNLTACATQPQPISNFLFRNNQKSAALVCCPTKRTTRKIDFGKTANNIKFYDKQKLWNSIPAHLRNIVPPNVTPVPIQKYPWTVAIMRGQQHHCGGSLIGKYTILTAAHCLYHLDAEAVRSLRVLLGHHDISRSEQSRATERRVMKTVFHREFSIMTLHNDIGLLILDYPVPMADSMNISPVKLSHEFPPVGGKATIAGWGKLGWNLPATPNLMETTINIWTNQKCAAMYGNLAPGGITNNMICGSAVGKDACRGDSGSPLMISRVGGETEQIGIVSWGIECGRYPSVHTRLTSFITWIQKNRLD